RWSHVEVTMTLPPERRYFYGDPGFLERVVQNLTKNAVEAMANRPVRKLGLSVEQSSDAGAPRTLLVVEDTGCGLGPEAMGRLFEPFRSSKSTGLGVGLAMSHWIVKESGGDIACESTKDVGTRFRIVLPAQPP